SYKGNKIGPGKEQSNEYLKENTAERDEIERANLELLLPNKYSNKDSNYSPKEGSKIKTKVNPEVTQDDLI
ncbi:DNA recombination/repair protein RecA, partial [Francisella tularensis subsp. holarctica]|nr:DNA recombination/repair protein RecA [Francisella tularensis subsp. holarctica]